MLARQINRSTSRDEQKGIRVSARSFSKNQAISRWYIELLRVESFAFASSRACSLVAYNPFTVGANGCATTVTLPAADQVKLKTATFHNRQFICRC